MNTYTLKSKTIKLGESKNTMIYQMAIKADNITEAKKIFKKATGQIGNTVQIKYGK